MDSCISRNSKSCLTTKYITGILFSSFSMVFQAVAKTTRTIRTNDNKFLQLKGNLNHSPKDSHRNDRSPIAD